MVVGRIDGKYRWKKIRLRTPGGWLVWERCMYVREVWRGGIVSRYLLGRRGPNWCRRRSRGSTLEGFCGVPFWAALVGLLGGLLDIY